MRNITAALLAAGLLISTAAQAADGALPAGKPAGVKKAELLTTPLIVVGVVAAPMLASPSRGVPLTLPMTCLSTGRLSVIAARTGHARHTARPADDSGMAVHV